MRTAFHESDDARGRLLHRQLRDVDDGTAEPPVDVRGFRELLVDRDEPAYCCRAACMSRARSRRISASRSGSIVKPTTFAGSMLKSSSGGAMPFTIGTFAVR